MGVLAQVIRIEVRLAAQLDDPLSQLVGMLRFLVGVLKKLRGSNTGLDATGHEVMALVAQDTHQLGCQ
ncbi:hypothetical protein D3C76_1467670 [compost metagenome]